MNQPRLPKRSSMLADVLFLTEKSPEDILVLTLLTTAAVLLGGALFGRTPWPVVPAGMLVFGLRMYHVRRCRLNECVAIVPEAAPAPAPAPAQQA